MFISVVIVFISKCVWLFIAVVESSSISTSKSIDLDNFNEINSNLNKNNVDKQQFDETDPIYWYVQAYRNLQRRQYLLPSSSSITNRPAKNVILFLGDGMGISTITASRILKGQQQQQHGQYHHSNNGEEAMLEMDLFPFTALIKTYNVDQQIPDSAATATAFLSGVKNNFNTLGVSAKVKRNDPDCDSVHRNSIDSIFTWALNAGKVAGIVTTTRVTHATPAAAYAHSQNRKWESNVDQTIINGTFSETDCKDIALQLIENDPGKRLSVILGGGRKGFLPETVKDPRGINGEQKEKFGERKDGRNLILEWLQNQHYSGLNESEYAYVNSSRGLHQLDYSKMKSLFGLFNYSHMEFDRLRDQSIDGEPSLSEMTEAAIKILSKHDKGFVLLVEGGLIDQAHHRGYASLSLHEVLEFDRAIRRARKLLSKQQDDTLFLVTADHSQPLVINGYSQRGNPINGLSRRKDGNQLPFTTLSYTSGPGFQTLQQRSNITNMALEQAALDLKYRFHSAFLTKKSHHSGEDVAIFSNGPMSYLFGGTLEQSFIAHAIGFATCIGPYEKEIHCRQSLRSKLLSLSSSTSTTSKSGRISNAALAIIMDTPEMLIIFFIIAGLIFFITILIIVRILWV